MLIFILCPMKPATALLLLFEHISGNMLLRWTNFHTEDGEKQWHNRDAEFEINTSGKEQLPGNWEKGWHCMFTALEALKEEDLLKTIYILNEPRSVIDAINRQMAHYPYHVGQIVYLGRLINNNQ